jgi:hypothetical protein
MSRQDCPLIRSRVGTRPTFSYKSPPVFLSLYTMNDGKSQTPQGRPDLRTTWRTKVYEDGTTLHQRV